MGCLNNHAFIDAGLSLLGVTLAPAKQDEGHELRMRHTLGAIEMRGLFTTTGEKIMNRTFVSKFVTTAVATAAVVIQPQVALLLHVAYLTAALMLLFVCGAAIAHAVVRYVETGHASNHAWAIRRAFEYVNPLTGSFWIDGWAGRLLSVVEGRGNSVRYF